MPVSVEKQTELATRRRLVEVLVGLGVSTVQMADMMGVSFDDVRGDRRHLGSTTRPKTRSDDERFCMVWRRYLQGLREDDVVLTAVLARHPEMVRLRAFVKGSVSHHLFLMNVSVQLPEPYARLLNDVFDRSSTERRLFADVLNDHDVNAQVDMFLRQLADESVEPSSVQRIGSNVHHRVLQIVADHFTRAPIVLVSRSPTLIQAVDASVAQLPDRLKQVVYALYGVGSSCTDATSRTELAKEFGVTRGYVGELERLAKRKIRLFCSPLPVLTPPTIQSLERENTSLEQTWNLAQMHRQALSQKPSDRLVSWASTKDLDRLIGAWNLLRQTRNCLEGVGILYVGDLVQKTERELLMIQNFGRRSLKELKGILSDLGLKLDMDVGVWKRPTSSTP